MKGRQIFLDTLGGAPAAALTVDGRLEDLLIDPGTPFAPGAILRGKIDRVTKGGAFVALPGCKGFLRGGAQRQGSPILVQVTGFPEKGKAVPLTARLVFKGRTVIVTPGAEGINISRQIKQEDERLRLFGAVDTYAAATSPHGIVVRTQARGAEEAEIAREVDAVLTLADDTLASKGGAPELLLPALSPHDLARREWLSIGEDDLVFHTGAFQSAGVLEELDALFAPDASLIVEPTRALVAVDVNTGADFSSAAGLKTNLDAARALPRHLRLRGLGGQVVVDFAPMPKPQRRTLEEALSKAFRADPVETSLVGWTKLGLFELNRKRDRRPLTEIWSPA
ncbi:MAG: ribonuclease E/G [Pseudomonadota bacterium]